MKLEECSRMPTCLSMPLIYVVMLPERSSSIKAVIMVMRKLLMFFPQTASNMSISVSSVKLCHGHQKGLQSASIWLQELGRGGIGTSKKQRIFLPKEEKQIIGLI